VRGVFLLLNSIYFVARVSEEVLAMTKTQAQQFFGNLPRRFQWTFHNIVGHPWSEVFFQFGAHRLSKIAHDFSTPYRAPNPNTPEGTK
jgi:hypothetical protein